MHAMSPEELEVVVAAEIDVINARHIDEEAACLLSEIAVGKAHAIGHREHIKNSPTFYREHEDHFKSGHVDSARTFYPNNLTDCLTDEDTATETQMAFFARGDLHDIAEQLANQNKPLYKRRNACVYGGYNQACQCPVETEWFLVNTDLISLRVMHANKAAYNHAITYLAQDLCLNHRKSSTPRDDIKNALKLISLCRALKANSKSMGIPIGQAPSILPLLQDNNDSKF